MYNFNEQLQKGKWFENDFFAHLQRLDQKPVFNNLNGNDRDFDIEANGLKYEVKADFFQNERFPIELKHFGSNGLTWNGWLYLTDSNYIVFYKHRYNHRFYLHTKTLKEFITANFCKLRKDVFTVNKTYKTWNTILTGSELIAARILKKIERY